MNILFVRSVVSFVLQNEFEKWRNSRANKENCQKGQEEMTDDEVQDLIELLEVKPCLWDIFSNEYTKREVKERAYTVLVKHFYSSSAIVKAKINALRAQLGREMAKELNRRKVR